MRKLFALALVGVVVFAGVATPSAAVADSSIAGCAMFSTESGQAVFRNVCDFTIHIKFEAGGRTYEVSLPGKNTTNINGLTGIVSILNVY